MATRKTATKKASTKKTATKKAPTKKTAAKKTATRKAPAKKTAARKAPASKAPASKAAAPRKATPGQSAATRKASEKNSAGSGVAKTATAHFKRAIAKGAKAKPAVQVTDLAASVHTLTDVLREQINKALAGSKTELHRAAVQAVVAQWLAGQTRIKIGGWREPTLPSLTADDARLVKALFARTKVQRFSLLENDKGEYGCSWTSTCKFTMGGWQATATWSAATNKGGDVWRADMTLTGFATNEIDFEAIEGKVQSGLPAHLLEACFAITAFDLVHSGEAVRPYEDSFTAPR